MPGEIDPSSDPPTDALTVGVPRAGLEWLGEQAAARRDAVLRARTKSAPPTPEVMWVTPAGGRTVYDIEGVPYPAGGTAVPTSDTYAHRRLRDGSLLLSEVPASTGTMAAQEEGEDVLAADIAIAAIQ